MFTTRIINLLHAITAHMLIKRGVNMLVQDLTREELEELKEAYFYSEETQDILPDYITSPADIPDDIIINHYDGISFVKADFWCNIENTGE